MTNNDQQKIVIKKGREKDNAFVSHCWQNSAKVSATRKYKYQNRKQTAGNLENNFGDVDVEWWLIDDDRVWGCVYVLASAILATNDMYDDYEK
jgi:hypothetical protein